MIRVTLPTRIIGISFYHPQGIGKLKDWRYTHCDVYSMRPDIYLDAAMWLARGTTKCSKDDNFRKETGKKLSLASALKKTDLTLSERSIIWSTYHHREGGLFHGV